MHVLTLSSNTFFIGHERDGDAVLDAISLRGNGKIIFTYNVRVPLLPEIYINIVKTINALL